jgi:hypothetical protein
MVFRECHDHAPGDKDVNASLSQSESPSLVVSPLPLAVTLQQSRRDTGVTGNLQLTGRLASKA